jgi:methionyl-tRNA formyltransferase
VSAPEQSLRLGWVGFHVEGIPALTALLEAGVRLEGVITLREEALAKRSAGADYAVLLGPHGVPVYPVGNINDEEAVRLLRRMELDVAFVIGWSQILRPEALATARIGMIGAHASLLPHHRGSAPINWCLIRGELSTGNSLIWLSDSVDEGQVIDQVPFPITPYDTCATLYEKVAASNREMVLRVLPKLLRGERPGRPQPPTDEPALPRRRPADGLLDWSQDSRAAYNFIRALARPYPGAFSSLDGERRLLWNAALLPGRSSPEAVPGQVLGPVYSPVEDACGQAVACGRGAVVLLEVEGPGGEILRGQALSEQPWEGKVWAND